MSDREPWFRCACGDERTLNEIHVVRRGARFMVECVDCMMTGSDQETEPEAPPEVTAEESPASEEPVKKKGRFLAHPAGGPRRVARLEPDAGHSEGDGRQGVMSRYCRALRTESEASGLSLSAVMRPLLAVGVVPK